MNKVNVEYAPSFLVSLIPERVVGRCAVCGELIYADDRVIVLDNGRAVDSEKMVHERCAVFQKEGLTEFLDLLGIDYYTGTAKEMEEDV